MKPLVAVATLLVVSMVAWAATAPGTLPPEVTEEHNSGRRSEIAADLASKTLDEARTSYEAGNVEQGDQELDMVGRLAAACLDATKASHRSRYWKRSEQKVSALAKRVRSLKDDLSYDRRDKADALASELDSIHDKLLAGVMGK